MAMDEERPRSKAEQERITALAKVPMGNRGVMIQAMDDLKEFAQTAVNSGTAPKKMEVGQAMMAIQAGLERGLGPLGGLQACVVINGVLSWRGWAAKAFIQQSGLVVAGTFVSGCEGEIPADKPGRHSSKAKGYATAKRKGYEKAFRREFSVDDAKRAGLWGKDGPWQTAPAAMLEWRAIGALARFDFPEILGGIPIAEEVSAGYGPPDEPKETAQQRAHRARPVVTDPLLGEIGDGDRTGLDEPGTPEEVVEGEVVSETTEPEQEPDGERQRKPATDGGGQEQPTAASDAGHRGAARGDEASPPPEEKRGRATACPRCEEEDSGYALLGECGVCNYPEAEPGS